MASSQIQGIAIYQVGLRLICCLIEVVGINSPGLLFETFSPLYLRDIKQEDRPLFY